MSLPRRITPLAIAALVTLVPASSAVTKPAPPADNAVKPGGLTIVGLTSESRLVKFPANRPQQTSDVGAVTGLLPGERLVGIDRRPANGLLYGVGSASRLYTLNTNTGAASFVATLSITLSGTRFGVDFNPVADRLRVVSNTGQNLRIVPTTGVATADLPLSWSGGPVTIAGAAYTNNDASASTTTTALYDIDTTSRRLFAQNPPNNGTLIDIGPLGRATGPDVGFDIYSPTSGGAAVSNTAYAVLGAGTSRGFYTVNLTTGAATQVALFAGVGSEDKLATVSDIAVPIDNG